MSDNGPHAKRAGKLRNGNPSGDPSKAPRCGANAKRTQLPCRSPAMPNGKCRLHGGASSGPKTTEGLERAKKSNWKHGRFSVSAKARRKEGAGLLREVKSLLLQMKEMG